ncbi:MAG: CPBP family intramembrane metalloprotease [Actinomycetia bacterium]|nr:CPBP family intramembrane metalloprotease [Actinomycetes bacterium]
MTDEPTTASTLDQRSPVARFYTWPQIRKGPYGWGRVAAALGLLLIGLVVALSVAGIAAATNLEGESASTPSPVMQVVQLTVPIATWWIIVLLVARFLFSMRFGDLISYRPGVRWGLLTKSLLLGVIAFALLAVAQMVLGEQSMSMSGPVVTALVLMLLLVPLQASAEELVFRGFVLQTVLGKIGFSTGKFWVISLVMASAFAALHAASQPTVLITYVLFSAIFALLAWKTAGIEAAIGVHVANNLVSVGAGLLRGENLVGEQSDVSAGLLPLVVQLALGLAVALIVIWMARREDPALR